MTRLGAVAGEKKRREKGRGPVACLLNFFYTSQPGREKKKRGKRKKNSSFLYSTTNTIKRKEKGTEKKGRKGGKGGERERGSYHGQRFHFPSPLRR